MKHFLGAVSAVSMLASFACGTAIAQGVPSAPNSTCPTSIALVGLDGGGVIAPEGQFTVTVRDLANNPVAGALMKFKLIGATDVALCATQPDAEVTLDCAEDLVRKFTNAIGQVTFTLSGRSTGTYSTAATGCSAGIYWGEILQCSIVVTTSTSMAQATWVAAT